MEARGATVLMRALPLLPAGVPIGALVLVRDVTEVRRRDRALMTKDATIREIHHRVKNNLQTVAALLRLQARRVDIPEAKNALEESVRRVASIALVHETLSMSSDEAVEFDGIVDRVATAATEVASTAVSVKMRREGSFGVLPAEIATSLVMVLNELLINAVEHGFPEDEEADRPQAGRRGGGHRAPVPQAAARHRGRQRPGPARRTSRPTPADASACRSSGPWPPASCAAPSSSATGPAAAPRPSSSSPSASASGVPGGPGWPWWRGQTWSRR